MPQITPDLVIPDQELWFTASRSPGPGGQNVNKVNSRVTLWFDLAASPSLSEPQKVRIQQRLATRINKEGTLWLVAYAERSQHANREAVLARFAALLRDALTEDTPRRKTRVPSSSRRKRLEAKKHRSALKQKSRRPVHSDD